LDSSGNGRHLVDVTDLKLPIEYIPSPAFDTTRLWPPIDGTISNIVIGGNAANSTDTWEITGSSYGAGTYSSTTDVSTMDVRTTFGVFNNNHGAGSSQYNGVTYGECFHPNVLTFPIILSLKLPDKIRFTTYATPSSLNADNTPLQASELPHSWTIEGSNNESDWVTLDTQTGQTTFTMRREYAFVNTDAWNNYRINITEGGSSYMVIGELQFQTPQINEIIFDGYNTISLGNIQEDATKVELFRGGVYLTNLIITDAPPSVQIGTSGSYNARIYKGSYLLVETPVVVVGTISSAFVVEPVARLVATGGGYNSLYDYLYFEPTPEGRYLYNLVETATENKISDSNDFVVEYDPSDNRFYDVGSSVPHTWGIDNTGTNLTAFPTQGNMPIHYCYESNGGLRFQFDNPYYVAPPEPVERIEAIGGSWYDEFDYLYFETTSDGRYLYGLVYIGTVNRYSPADFDVEYDSSDGKFYDVGSGSPVTWGIDDLKTNLSAFELISISYCGQHANSILVYFK